MFIKFQFLFFQSLLPVSFCRGYKNDIQLAIIIYYWLQTKDIWDISDQLNIAIMYMDVKSLSLAQLLV